MGRALVTEMVAKRIKAYLKDGIPCMFISIDHKYKFKVMKHYFMFVYMVLKWSAQKTTEACDWLIGTHISDKWRPYAFGLIDIFACY